MTDELEEEWHSLKYWQNRPLAERLAIAHIPPRFRDASFENYEMNEKYGTTEAFEAMQCAPVLGHWLILVGKTGRGKTHLAAAMLRDFITIGNQVGFFAGARFLTTMFADARRNWGLLPEQYRTQHLIKYIQRQWPLVVLDDLGAEGDDRTSIDGVQSLLSNRYECELATVITTQLTPDIMRQRYGDDVVSRMREVGRIFVMDGGDYREKES